MNLMIIGKYIHFQCISSLTYILNVSEKLPVNHIHLHCNIGQYLVDSERKKADTSTLIFLWHKVPCITTMENDIHHTRMHYNHSLMDHRPVVFIALYRKMQSFGATLSLILIFRV